MITQCLYISMTVNKTLPHPLTPKVKSNVKYLNFAITQTVVNIFNEISLADRGKINMKYIKRDFRSKDPTPWVDLGGWTEAKIKLFSEYDHVAHQINGMTHASAW